MERSTLANKIQSPWAIKKLLKSQTTNKQITARLKEEAEILRSLNHPNIVGFRAFVKGPDGKDCLAMEECTTCLGDLIEQRNENGLQAFAAKYIIKVAWDIAEALHYLHDTALILHCDIKSYNILVKGDFFVNKLCDFGVAMPLNKDGSLNEKKVLGQREFVEFQGTKLWSPAEVLQMNPVITSKADIFSFGLTIWEMLALCPPHCYEDTTDIGSCIMKTMDISCITIDDSTDDSGSDSSLDVTDASINELNTPKDLGKRPALPVQTFDKDYLSILQVFYCCTEEDWRKRLTAADLCSIMKDISLDVVFIG